MLHVVRAKSLLTGLRPPPPSAWPKPIAPRRRWNGYFLYLPDGVLTASHLYTLDRLRALPGGLLAICATPGVEQVPEDLLRRADAVCWKGLSGYDFSAYALALAAVAERAPGADLFLLNDSVLGPFGDVEALLERSSWDLTGFTASAAFENHVQSYAFLIRNVNPAMVRALRTVVSTRYAFNYYQNVVNWQETRLARVAARSMSVGALWYSDGRNVHDPSLQSATDLVASGLPFLKRSLLGRYAGFQDRDRLEAILKAAGHPL